MGTEQADSEGTLSCPKCGVTDIRKHSGCLSPVIGVVLLVVLTGLTGSRSVGVAIQAIAGIALVFVFAGTIVAGLSSIFGKHKCKSCGAKWR